MSSVISGHVLERRRHVAASDPQREALGHRRLADARLAGEDRIVLAATHEDVHHLADLLVAARHRIDLPLARALGQIDGKAPQRLLFPHRRRRHRAARLPRRGERGAVGRLQAVLRRARDDPGEAVGQRVGRDPIELPRDVEKRVPKRARLDERHHDVAGADLRLTEHEARIGPRAFDCVLHVGREIADRGGAARQPVQGVGHILGEPRTVDLEVAHDAMEVGVLKLQDLLQPVLELHIGIAAQLAEHGRALDRLVREAVQLPEERHPADLGHEVPPYAAPVDGAKRSCRRTTRSASRVRSPASRPRQ